MASDADDLAPLRRTLGDLLAACRNATGLTQQQLGTAVGYARVTVGTAESGHRQPAADFWARCDDVLGAGGELTRAYQQLTDTRARRRRERAEQKRTARGPITPPVSSRPSTAPAAPAAPAASSDPLGAMLIAAARESSADALLRAGDLGPGTIPHLTERARHLARSYNQAGPAVVFLEAKDLRGLALTVIRGTHRPRHLTDLYAVLGQTTALMGSLAFDLGRWDAAAILTRSATDYADLAGHASLTAWTYGLQATVAFWRRDTPAALAAIDRGLLDAPAGRPRVRLRCIAARAYAVAGDTAGVTAALRAAADEARSGAGGRDELHDDIGGEFRFDDARAAACAGAAWLDAGDGVHAEMSVRDVLNAPSGALTGSIGAGARLDLASALLLQGELASAGAELDTVLGVGDGPVHAAAVAGRVRRVHDQLASPRWQNDTTAQQPRDAAAAWLEAAGRPEPATTS